MAYSIENFKTKKALKEAVKSGQPVRIYSPGIFPPKTDGIEYLEGPHFPKPHTWYAKVQMMNGVVLNVT